MYLNHGVEVEEEVELRDYPKGSLNHRSLDTFQEFLIASVWSGAEGSDFSEVFLALLFWDLTWRTTCPVVKSPGTCIGLSWLSSCSLSCLASVRCLFFLREE